MLSGSAILRVMLVLVAAAGIAGIVQFVWTRGTPNPNPTPTPTTTEPSAATQPAARPEPSRPAPPPEPVPPEPAPPPPVAEAPPSQSLSLPRREPAPPPAPAPAPTPSPTAPDPAEAAAENAPPAAVALVDLNTASLTELNNLKGGGSIGRAIIGHRPYTSVDQLLSKRVLNRATYQRIKDQVTVR